MSNISFVIKANVFLFCFLHHNLVFVISVNNFAVNVSKRCFVVYTTLYSNIYVIDTIKTHNNIMIMTVWIHFDILCMLKKM